jgi:hypothetical protein
MRIYPSHGIGQPQISIPGYADPLSSPVVPDAIRYQSTVPPPPVTRPGSGFSPDHTESKVTTPGYRDEPPPPYAPPAPETEVLGWWARQSGGTRLMIYAGAALTGGMLLYLLLRPRAYQQNRASQGGRRASARRGRIRTIKGGRRFGHQIPPRRYWLMGARRPSDYAYPEGYRYPLIFRDSSGKVNRARTVAHIRAAKTYFSRSKHLYPKDIRRVIARRINRSSLRYGAGPTTMTE